MEGAGLALLGDKDDAGGGATGVATILGLGGGGANVDAATWACDAEWDFM